MTTAPLLLTLTLLGTQASAGAPPLEPLPASDASASEAPAAAPATTDARAPSSDEGKALLLEAEEAPAPELTVPAPLPPPAEATPSDAPPAAAPEPPKKPRLLVLDLVDQGAGLVVTGGLGQAMQAQAVQSYPGDEITTAQLKVALDAAGLQALAGCMSEQCMTSLAGTVEAERALGGSVAKAGDDYVITLVLVDPSTGNRVAQEQRKVPTHEDLAYYAVKQLTSLVLTGKSAESLVPVAITASEPGAVVIVDGKHVGAAPVTTQLDPGRHEVRVEKDGFVTWKTTTEVQEATPVELHAELLSPGFPIWPFAVSAGVVSVAALAGGVWFGVSAQNAYDGSLPLGDPADSYWGKPDASTAYLADKRLTVRERAVWADVLYGTAATFGAIAIGLFAWELGAAAMSE